MNPRLISEFRSIVGDAGLVSGPEQLRTYECDGLTLFRVVPDLVLLPATAEEVQAIARVCSPGTNPDGGARVGHRTERRSTASQGRRGDQRHPDESHPGG